MKKLILLVLLATGLTSCAVVESQKQAIDKGDSVSIMSEPEILSGMYIRGTFNNWNSSPMAEISNKVWAATVTFGTSDNERFKFDTFADWSKNYGDNNADGIVEQNGADIHVSPGIKAYIVFDENKGKYYVSTDTRTSTVTCRPGPGINEMLFWRYEPYYNVVPVKVYKNGEYLTNDIIHPTSKDGVQALFQLDLYAAYKFVVNYTNESLHTVLTASTNVLITSQSQYINLGIKITTNNNYKSTYENVSLRGTFNNWGTTAMTLISNYTWQAKVNFNGSSEDSFKFDIYNDWSLNFGDNNNDKIADQNGANIPTGEVAGTYTIIFNDQTRQYIVIPPHFIGGSLHINVSNYFYSQYDVSNNVISLYKDGEFFKDIYITKNGKNYEAKADNLPYGSYKAIYDGRELQSLSMSDALCDYSYYGENEFSLSENQTNADITLNIVSATPFVNIRSYQNKPSPYPGFKDDEIVGLNAVLYKNGIPLKEYKINKYFHAEGMYSSEFASIKIWDNLEPGTYGIQVDTFKNGTNYNSTMEYFTVTSNNVYFSLIVKSTNVSAFAHNYPSMFLRSDTIDWGTQPMTLVSNYVWKGNATFTNGNGTDVKFDVYGDWSLNFGDNFPRDGIADQNGYNISLRYPTGTFEFYFDEQSRKYWFVHK